MSDLNETLIAITRSQDKRNIGVIDICDLLRARKFLKSTIEAAEKDNLPPSPEVA